MGASLLLSAADGSEAAAAGAAKTGGLARAISLEGACRVVEGSGAMTQHAPDWSRDAHAVLSRAGVRQIGYVPDGGLARLIELCRTDNAMRAVALTTEEEGVALLAGAWLGGDKGALLMQSSGVGNIVNMLSMTKVCSFPLPMVVTMRGEWGEFNPWQVPMGQNTQAILERCGVVVHRPESPADVGETLAAAAKLAFDGQMGTAVLIPQRFIGTKEFK
jgi:sulfopyruvate decarboxylase alpha subunit